MICLDNTDVIEGGASVTAVVDYQIHGLVGATFTQLAAGVLSNTLTTVLYTAGTDVSVVSIVLVNTHSATVNVTLRLDPANGGNPRYLIPKEVMLGVGYSLHTDGVRITVMSPNGSVVTTDTTSVSDVAYDATSWNGVTDIAPSKNAVRDKVETLMNLTGSNVYAADAGASDAYAITLTPAPSAYTAGMPIRFKANTANTGAATLNVNSLGAKTIKKKNDQDLVTGDIESGQIVTVVYDGTNFQMMSCSAAQAPSFQVVPLANQNDIAVGSWVTVVWGTERFDVGGNFASNTFTAPVTGKYTLQVSILTTLDSGCTGFYVSLLTSNKDYSQSIAPSKMFSASSNYSFQIAVVADMDASDTAYVRVQQMGGAQTTDIKASYSWFSGMLI